jgi:hypothetical protein
MRKQSEINTTQSEKTIRQEARDQFELVELNERQLDMVAGGGKKSQSSHTEYLTYDLGGVVFISGYSLSSGGDMPVE